MPAKFKVYIARFASYQGLVMLLFFLSGACSLVYEVAWMRLLNLVFGVTAIATSTVLASFMGGLALGSFIFGRFIDTRKRPLRIYGLLELGVGLFALAMPFILSGLDNVYVIVYRQFGASLPVLSLLRFLLSFLVLLVPATLMGGTLPIVSRFVVQRWGRLGWSVGNLYFINTLGAAAGTLLAGFALMLLLGVREATYLAALVNIVIGFAAIYMDFRLSRNRQENDRELENDTSEQHVPALPGYSTGQARLALIVFGIAGFCSLALEVLWTRSLVFILDNTTHAFATMLSAFLLGIALGSLIMARFTDRIRRPFLWLGIIMAGIGLSALVSVPVFINLGAEMGSSEGLYQPAAYWQWAALRFGRSFLVMLVPTLLMGMAFPLVAKIYTLSPRLLGRSIGNVYSLNTIGGVAGSLAAAFVFIPFIGVNYSVVLVAGIYSFLGLVLLLRQPAVSAARRLKTAAVPALAFAVSAILVTAPGQLIFSSYIEQLEARSLIYYDEGIGSTVKVYANDFGYRYLSIDGFPVASTTPRHRDIQQALGHFPLLLSPAEDQKVCVIGLGAGGSSWAVTRHDIQRLDVVELVPSVVEAARLLPEVNHQLFDQPELDLILADGRNYLLVTEEKYDVISVDATSPKGAGNGNLYSLEFYRSCRDRLTSSGVIVQWLPYHLLSSQEIDMTINTFREVFPQTSLWFSPFRNYFLMIATMQEFSIDFQQLSSRIQAPVIQEELGPIYIRDVFDMICCFIMGPDELAEYTEDTPLNTDNHPYIEYSPSLSYFVPVDYARENILRIAGYRQIATPYLQNLGSNTQAVLQELELRFAETPVERYWPLFFEDD